MTPITPSDWAERAASTQWDAREIGTVLASVDKAYTAIHGPPMESDDADSRDPFYIGDYVEKAFKRFVNENADLRSQLVAAQRERDEALRSVEHSAEWYQRRFDRLREWVKDLPDAKRTEYFSIVANGTKDPYEHPSYQETVRGLRHERDQLKTDLAQSRAELGEVRSTLQRIANLTAPECGLAPRMALAALTTPPAAGEDGGRG